MTKNLGKSKKNNFLAPTFKILIISILILHFNDSGGLVTQGEVGEVTKTISINETWNKTFGGTGEDVASSVIQMSDGNLVLAGYTDSFGVGKRDFWLIKTNIDGTVVLNTTFGGQFDDQAYSVIQSSDNGFVLGGVTKSFGAGRSDFWLVKTDANGQEEWNKTFGGSGEEIASSVIQTADSGYALAGYATATDEIYANFYLVKTDANGQEEWNKTFGGIEQDRARSLLQTSDEGFVIFGDTASFGYGEEDFWLIKTDANGQEEWNYTYGGILTETGYSFIQTSDGGFALTGFTSSFGGNGNAFLVKTTVNGEEEWNNSYGGPIEDVTRSIISTGDNKFILGGNFGIDKGGIGEFWLLKVDKNGQIEGEKRFFIDAGYYSRNEGNSVIQTLDGELVLVGTSISSPQGIILMKAVLIKTSNSDFNTMITWTTSISTSATSSTTSTSANSTFFWFLIPLMTFFALIKKKFRK